MAKISVEDVINSIEVNGDNITSKTSGKTYTKEEFIKQISKACGWTKTDIRRFESHFTNYIKPRSEKSIYVEQIIDKYGIKYSDGVYMVNGVIVTIEDIYRLLWKEEKLLPDEVTDIMGNIEKISEPMNLQCDIYEKQICSKAKSISWGGSKYINSLYEIYPDIEWRRLLHNILCPNTKPMFHIFYDDGVGGTGKSTLLEVLTMIVGKQYVSNILLDQFGNRFMFGNMLGKYLNIGDDNGKNDELQNVGTLKSIVTGNRVTIDRKFMQPIECKIFAKQLFATNILPYIDFTDGGIMRRLNIVKMNKVIPKTAKLPEFTEEELGKMVTEINAASDLEKNENELAITSSPLYRFYTKSTNISYDKYCDFCDSNGFKKMNVINFEVKSKFIKAHLDGKLKPDNTPPDEMPW